MLGFLKIISTIAVIGIVVIAMLFVLDIATTEEVKLALEKILLVLGLIALSGVAVFFLSK